jgi:hypothetical protein
VIKVEGGEKGIGEGTLPRKRRRYTPPSKRRKRR